MADDRWLQELAAYAASELDCPDKRRTQAPRGSVRTIKWDPQGRFLAYLDGDASTVHLWNLGNASEQEVVVRLQSEIVGGVAISPDGRTMAVGDGYAIDLFATGQKQNK